MYCVCSLIIWEDRAVFHLFVMANFFSNGELQFEFGNASHKICLIYTSKPLGGDTSSL